MPIPLNLLIVEDSEDDARLLAREFARGGYELVWERVESEPEMRAALGRRKWDFVVSDYSLPRFSAPAALNLMEEAGLDLPFFVVSGVAGEETAIAMMKAGAHDFFLKGLFTRLVPAVNRELEQAAQRRARRKAEEAHAQLAAIVESSSDAIIGRTLDGTVTAWNAGAEKLYGYTAEEAVGRPLTKHVPADRAGEIAENLERVRRGEVVDNLETVRIRKDGTRIEVSLTVSPIRSSSGLITGSATIARDITERKRAEESIQKLLRAVEQAKNAIVMTDQNGEITYVNPAFQEIYGYSRQEALGKTPRILKSGRHDHAFYERFWQRLRAGESAREEFVNKTRDGRLVTVESSVSPVLDAQGRHIGFIAVQDDVTERKRDQEVLAARERHFRSLIENAQDIITVIDIGGQILFESPSVERILGLPPDAYVGKSAFEFVHPDDVAAVQAALQRASASPGLPQTALFRFRHADGSWRTLAGIGSVLTGEPSFRFVVNSRDVTESRALEEQLRQSQKMDAVGRLAGGVAHDFNNLLTAILGYSDLLASKLPSGSGLHEDLDEIREASHRAAGLTRQLLAFSRKQVLEPVVLRMNDLVSNIEKMLRRVIGEDIRLVTRLDPTEGNVLADPGQLEQVIVNLAVNARDAMPNGGTLTIETAVVELDGVYAQRHAMVPPGRYMMLAVSDTGIGMDPPTQERIFEPFFTTKEKGKGTGLGLSTVYGIVKQSGGYIWVYSEPGKGSTFKVYLPMVDEATTEPLPSSSQSVPAVGTETILIVEDEASIRALSRRVLEKSGYRVLDAGSGKEALERLHAEEGPVHLLLTDLVMPDMSGTELASRLQGPHPNLRVLFMSGYTDDAVVQGGLLGRGRAFLQKPFTPQGLVRKVRELLEAPEHGPAA